MSCKSHAHPTLGHAVCWQQASSGNSPLLMALKIGSTALVTLLKEHNANVDFVNKVCGGSSLIVQGIMAGVGMVQGLDVVLSQTTSCLECV
jgi:hypothetical protein